MSKLQLVEFAEDGTVYIRFRKDDGGWHRTSINPDTDPDEHLDIVDNHLVAMGMTKATDAVKNAAARDVIKRMVNLSRATKSNGSVVSSSGSK